MLSLPSLPPLGLMFQASYTQTAKTVPDTQNGDVGFPQEMSLFLAGRLAPNVGTFLQMTYDGAEDHFGIDNTEFRYADTSIAGRQEHCSTARPSTTIQPSKISGAPRRSGVFPGHLQA